MSDLVDAAAARIYGALRAYHDPDGDDTVLLAMCAAAAAMIARPIDALRSDDTGTGGRRMYDPDRAPAWALEWLSQQVGLDELPSFLSEAEQRALIRDAPGMRRGTPAAMIAAVQPYLTGSGSVIFVERDGGPYKLTVVTRTSETPDPDAALAALMNAKPAGIDLTYVISDLEVWSEAVNTWDTVDTGLTWHDALTDTTI